MPPRPAAGPDRRSRPAPAVLMPYSRWLVPILLTGTLLGCAPLATDVRSGTDLPAPAGPMPAPAPSRPGPASPPPVAVPETAPPVAAPAPPGAPLPPRPPAGFPVPEPNAVTAAYRALDAVPTYRAVLTIVPPAEEAAQLAAAGTGFGAIERAVVAPDLQSAKMTARVPAPDGRVADWELTAVIRGSRWARRLVGPWGAAQEPDALARQRAIAQTLSAMAAAFARTSGAMTLLDVAGATGQASLAAAAPAGGRPDDFRAWQCEPLPLVGAAAGPRSAQLTDLRLLGAQRLDGQVPVRSYEFYVLEAGTLYGPMVLHVGEAGLPLRLEMTAPTQTGSMRVDYFDFGAPIRIDVPGCLATG